MGQKYWFFLILKCLIPTCSRHWTSLRLTRQASALVEAEHLQRKECSSALLLILLSAAAEAGCKSMSNVANLPSPLCTTHVQQLHLSKVPRVVLVE